MLERLLSEVLVEAQGGESLLGSIKIAVLPIAKVFTMCFMGFLMASKYVNILPASGRKLLNGVITPLLYFSFLAFLVGICLLQNTLRSSFLLICAFEYTNQFSLHIYEHTTYYIYIYVYIPR